MRMYGYEIFRPKVHLVSHGTQVLPVWDLLIICACTMPIQKKKLLQSYYIHPLSVLLGMTTTLP